MIEQYVINQCPATFCQPRGAYPELFAVVGSQVPNLWGLFLRDHGGNSAELGTIQANLIKDHVHISYYTDRASDGSGYFTTGGVLEYAPARTDPVEGGGIENRPVNQAVRHLIRARP